MLNQSKQPDGDADSIDSMPLEDETQVKKRAIAQRDEKFMSLYDDAKHRNLRQEHIYNKCIDKECTFKPKLVTQTSKLS